MEKTELLAELGRRLKGLIEDEKAIVARARVENPWFTERWVAQAASHWAHLLTEDNIRNWLNAYDTKSNPNKRIGIIMAGNVPFVGLHDLISVIACNSRAVCKLSSNDQVLMKWVIATLKEIDSTWVDKLTISDSKLGDIDALIATGSDNSARYFEHYFKDIPKVIRKNRSSVAILDPVISQEDLKLLADDIFYYFGLGCRNVGKVFLPHGFEVTRMIDAFEGYKDTIHHHKYANNYTYHKAILLMNLDKHLDNGFLILQEKEEELKPPLSVLFYSFYTDKDELITKLTNSDQVQCVVGKGDQLVELGQAQKPALNEYADKVNILDFVLSI